ncbi:MULTISPECIES: MBL fold metallo-hydrolase [Roseivirga]|uniref:MBL fold hydrolase n=1 Tax=Roseivirga thermotolerans TaxID=1758176 RepID=A0ABQ3I2M4_9BACT|nr:MULTISPECIES: MBL fold metallo-hydrolase [Roseivirga]MEC7753133.1 MBL fold metallo-hydrolase [Bacteroidota bacterium]GHE58887.1 MBL fold hydrolase [Roseivirga thermotolerans]|tara:strand:+ start:23067 stop:23705 length:639 start_codon:yes stop_codon:yes gene_type:complete
MHVKTFTFNPFMENTYVVYEEGKGVIIDPGCFDPAEESQLVSYIERESIHIEKILNTHGHIDHVLGNAFAMRQFNAPLYIGENDLDTLRSVEAYAPSYGFQKYTPSQPDFFLKEGDTVEVGSGQLEVLFVPGHAPGHIAFYNRKDGFLIGGDVLFHESIGRTDLPGGNYDTLIASIREKFFKLNDETLVYPGHGIPTTISHEKKYNPFCAIQ